MRIEEITIEMARQEGQAKDRLEANNFFVENLLRSTDFNDEEITSLIGVPVSFVEEIKKNSTCKTAEVSL